MNANIIGGQGASKRRESDFYPTPPEPTKALIRFLVMRGVLSEMQTIWECACGQGDMSKVLVQSGYNTIATDINGDFPINFLTDDCPAEFDWIITNPPFSLAEQFIRKAYGYEKPFALLLKSQYWHSAKRLRLFRETRPSFILPLTWRPDFTFGGKGSPMMDVLWTAWVPGVTGCEYEPLDREASK